MPDANAARQRRHDACLRTTRCPRCGAWAGRECHEVLRPRSHHVYPQTLWDSSIRAANQPVTVTTRPIKVEGKMGRSDWGRQLGGLHAARWVAWEGLDAITRLGDLVDG